MKLTFIYSKHKRNEFNLLRKYYMSETSKHLNCSLGYEITNGISSIKHPAISASCRHAYSPQGVSIVNFALLIS